MYATVNPTKWANIQKYSRKTKKHRRCRKSKCWGNQQSKTIKNVLYLNFLVFWRIFSLKKFFNFSLSLWIYTNLLKFSLKLQSLMDFVEISSNFPSSMLKQQQSNFLPNFTGTAYTRTLKQQPSNNNWSLNAQFFPSVFKPNKIMALPRDDDLFGNEIDFCDILKFIVISMNFKLFFLDYKMFFDFLEVKNFHGN